MAPSLLFFSTGFLPFSWLLTLTSTLERAPNLSQQSPKINKLYRILTEILGSKIGEHWNWLQGLRHVFSQVFFLGPRGAFLVNNFGGDREFGLPDLN